MWIEYSRFPIYWWISFTRFACLLGHSVQCCLIHHVSCFFWTSFTMLIWSILINDFRDIMYHAFRDMSFNMFLWTPCTLFLASRIFSLLVSLSNMAVTDAFSFLGNTKIKNLRRRSNRFATVMFLGTPCIKLRCLNVLCIYLYNYLFEVWQLIEFTVILPGYICCIKHAGSTLHRVFQTGQYMLYRLVIMQLLEWNI